MFRYQAFQGDTQLAAAAKNTPPLRKGAAGRGVEVLQQALIDLGYEMPRSVARKGRPDGIFGSETDATVRAFQRDFALHMDGKAGAGTLQTLDALMCDADVMAGWLETLSRAP